MKEITNGEKSAVFVQEYYASILIVSQIYVNVFAIVLNQIGSNLHYSKYILFKHKHLILDGINDTSQYLEML